MHATEFEPLISVAALLEGFIFGSLLATVFLFPAVVRAFLFVLAAFLFGDAAFPDEGPAYIYEFFLAAVPGFIIAFAFTSIAPLYTIVAAAVGAVFLVRRIRAIV